MLKKILALVLVVVLTATIAIGGTLAYLTDRDSEANVFTVGDVSIELSEDFYQGATLVPGVNIEKKPIITNTGKNDAWVWLEVAIPAALDNWALDTQEGSNNNIIHWNQLGATTDGYVNDTRVANAIAAGHLPEDITAQEIMDNNMTWNLGGKADFSKQEEIDGVKYNKYIIGYNKALTPGESTLANVYNFFLDARLDIDPDGNWALVENGNVTDLEWNSNDNGNPVVYVSAYAIQEEGFANVDDAIRAYNAQWGDNGSEYGEPGTPAVSAEDLTDALGEGKVYLTEDVSTDPLMLNAGESAEIDLQGNTLTANGYIQNNGDELVIENGSVKSGDAANYGVIGTAGTTTLNDVDVTSGGGGVAAADGAEVIFNSGSLSINSKSTSGRYLFYAEGAGTVITINGGEFDFNKTQNQKRAYICAMDGTTVYVNGGNFGTASTRSGYTAGILTYGTGKVIITGGTFKFDPSTWVADGYQAVKSGDTWTVSAK